LTKRRTKIEQQGRITSFTYLLNDKKGVIGQILSKIPGRYREVSFMAAQLVYTIVTVWPSVLYYDHKKLSGAFLILMFSVSVWNGASFYVEVFGRRFEKQLIALRREFEAAAQATVTQAVTEINSTVEKAEQDDLRRRNAPEPSQGEQ